MDQTLGDRVRLHRFQERQTQAESAAKIGVSRGTLRQIEQGKRFTALTVVQCLGIAAWMDVEIDIVIGWVKTQLRGKDGT